MILLSAEQMKYIDNYTTKELSVPVSVLMHNAANAVIRHMYEGSDNSFLLSKEDKILVVCGPGNNGCDGLIIADILISKGIDVSVFVPVPFKENTLNDEFLNIYLSNGGLIFDGSDLNQFDAIVDCIFGIGLNREITGIFKETIDKINDAHERHKTKVFACDIPSGVDTDNGRILGCAVNADITVTFAYAKLGQFIYPGRKLSGELYVEDIGIDIGATDLDLNEVSFTMNKGECRLPHREVTGNKSTFGKILVIAGSKNISGACYLSAVSAYRSGAGYVNVFTHKNNEVILKVMLPEALYSFYDDDYFDEKELNKLISNCDSIVIGPGLGCNDTAGRILETVLKNRTVPVVFDADAINLLAGNDKLMKIYLSNNTCPSVFTPHPLELSRLNKCELNSVLNDYCDIIKRTATGLNAVVVGKGAASIVSDGKRVYINSTGNDGMGTAGSGDVLSGIAGAFISKEPDTFMFTCSAVCVHGLAGDIAAERYNRYSLMAGDIAAAISEILNKEQKC